MTIEKLSIDDAIKAHFAPMLRAEGFTGFAKSFRRVQNGHVHVVNIQGSSYGGQFAINLAIQPLAIPDVRGNTPDLKKIIERVCEFRRRLSESGADQWWPYHDASSLAQATIDAAKVYGIYGRPWFNAMSTSPTLLDTLSIEQLSGSSAVLEEFQTTEVRLALILSRIREAEGRISDAVAFAVYGLEHAGATFSLTPELERIAALDHSAKATLP